MSGIYEKAKNKLLTPGALGATSPDSIHWLNDNLKAVLINVASYSANLATDEFLANIPVGARVATSPNLAGKTLVAAVIRASDVIVTAVSGAAIGAIVLYKDTGSAATSPLLAYLDTGSGFPLTPSGGDVTIAWSAGANGIFKL